MNNYYKDEFYKALTDNPTLSVQVKVKGTAGESKWLPMHRESLAELDEFCLYLADKFDQE